MAVVWQVLYLILLNGLMVILNLALLSHYLIYLNISVSSWIHAIQIQFRLFELFLYDFIIVLRL